VHLARQRFVRVPPLRDALGALVCCRELVGVGVAPVAALPVLGSPTVLIGYEPEIALDHHSMRNRCRAPREVAMLPATRRQDELKLSPPDLSLSSSNYQRAHRFLSKLPHPNRADAIPISCASYLRPIAMPPLRC
jgi:hypothetical protein